MLDIAPVRQIIWASGLYRLAIGAVEFPDAGEKLPPLWMPRIIHEADAYFREVSGGAVRWIPAPQPVVRIRLRRPSSAWHLQRRSLLDRVRFWRRILRRFDPMAADALLVVLPKTAAMRGCFAVGPRWNSPRLDDALGPLGDAAMVRGAVVKSSTPWGTVMHELGHVVGLPDLYDYDFARDHRRWSVRASQYVGAWDLMGRIPPDATSIRPHPMAWTKTLAGWMTPQEWRPEQDRYHVGPGSKTSAVRVCLAPERWLYVEGRLHQGFDVGLPTEGVLVSIADESLPEGRGPLRLVVPARQRPLRRWRRRPPLADAAWQPGEACAYGPITVQVLSKTAQGFDVRITHN